MTGLAGSETRTSLLTAERDLPDTVERSLDFPGTIDVVEGPLLLMAPARLQPNEDQMRDLQIEYLPINALRPRDRNARTHSKRQISQIERSIYQYGFVNSILVDEDNRIIAGHGRWQAAKVAKLDTVPVVRLSHLSETQKRAYVIADNRLAEKAGWDPEILAIEFQGLIELGFDVELTGFEIAEVDIVLEDADDSERRTNTPDDHVPEPLPGPPVSQPGDLWIMGPHRAFCGDARSQYSYDKLLGGSKADMVATDPPYNVRIAGHVSGLGKIRHSEFAMASGEMKPDDFADFLEAVLLLAARASRDGALHFVFMDWRHIEELMRAAKKAYSQFLNLCIWNKTNGGMGSLYRSKHELVFVYKVGDAPHVNNVDLGRHGRYRTNVWDYAGVNTFRVGRLDELAMHPTVKPVALVADAIKDASRRSNIILDPFAGSGTTIIAAETTGRRGYAMEVDSKYVDVIVRRWQLLTGKDAILESTGATFEDTRNSRHSPSASAQLTALPPVSEPGVGS